MKLLFFNLLPFILQFATHHGQSIPSHIYSWMQAPWCDSWFNGAHQDTENFVLLMLSWSQLQYTSELLVALEDSISPIHYTFLTLMWQGIDCLHTDKIIHYILPMHGVC